MKLEAEKQENTDKKNSEGRKQRLQQEITQLNTQLQSLTLENRENEQELRRVCILFQVSFCNPFMPIKCPIKGTCKQCRPRSDAVECGV